MPTPFMWLFSSVAPCGDSRSQWRQGVKGAIISVHHPTNMAHNNIHLWNWEKGVGSGRDTIWVCGTDEVENRIWGNMVTVAAGCISNCVQDGCVSTKELKRKRTSTWKANLNSKKLNHLRRPHWWITWSWEKSHWHLPSAFSWKHVCAGSNSLHIQQQQQNPL